MTILPFFLCVRVSDRVKANRSVLLSGQSRVTAGPARKRVIGASPISEWRLHFPASEVWPHSRANVR